jgi:hypothetical protein
MLDLDTMLAQVRQQCMTSALATAALLREVGGVYERTIVLAGANARDPVASKHYLDAATERQKDLEPVTRQPKPPVKPAVPPGEDSPELKALRRKRDEAAALLVKVKDHPENRAKVEKAIKTFDDAIARVEAREAAKRALVDPTVKSLHPTGSGGDPPADNPNNALTPEERKAAGEGVGGTAERNSAPDTAFLDERSRKYPWQAPDKDGDWKPDRDLLIAAEKCAAAEGKPNIEARAKRLLAEHFPKSKGEPPKKPTSEPARKRRFI